MICDSVSISNVIVTPTKMIQTLIDLVCDQYSQFGDSPSSLTQKCLIAHFRRLFFFCAEKQIDLSTVDLKKLKVRDLKKILNDWDEECDGCLEKGDYIRRIEELKPKYASAAPATPATDERDEL